MGEILYKIALTKGKFSLVDRDEHKRISSHKWHLSHNGYAIRLDYKNNKSVIYMHRAITNCKKPFVVDHINRDKLDNRRKNLRVCTNNENVRNSPSRGGSSSYKGVSHAKEFNKFRCRIGVDNRMIHLGYFVCEKEAAKAYNVAALEYHKEFAYLNEV
jgi:hypothetical protein